MIRFSYMEKFLSWVSRKSFTNAFEPVFKERTLQEEGPSWGQWPFIITVSEASIEHSSQLKEIWDLWWDKMTFMIAQDKLKATRLHDSLPLIHFNQ